MDPEACGSDYNDLTTKKIQRTSLTATLLLAYQSFGVVYGDLSTSPLYVYRSTFSGKLQLHEDDAEVLGVLSFILYTLTFIPLVKYIFFVLSADDNGEGGTFALYSLLCRNAKLSLLPNQQAADEELSTYKLQNISPGKQQQRHQRGVMFKAFLESHKRLRISLLLVVLLGTCMVIGDGVLTPAISVLSSVYGIKVAVDDLNEHVVELIACLILVGLFALQHHGTRKVSFMFAPIVLLWLFSIGGIGIYNIARWNPHVIRAWSPYYMYKYFKRTGFEGWTSLGGILLCITGTEAMFADLGHFSQLSIKIAFGCVVYPCLVCAYMGQAAYLSRNHSDIEGSFYKSIPKPVYWPVVVIATLASVVGSQAVISATFSIIKQCMSLGCFPRVKVVHTSKDIYGQIYIPEINWMLLLLCLAVTLGFRDTIFIGHAYGIAVITVMFVTTFLMSLVIVMVWKRSIFFALVFFLFFGAIELLYASSAMIKVHEGGWVPLALSVFFVAVMYTWHYGTAKKYEFDLQNKVSMKWLLTLGPSLGIVRVPGIGLIYSELVTGVPAIFSHFVTNLPAFHQVLIFVCIKSVPVPYVPPEERFLVGRIGPKEYRMFRCIVRYGYKDVHKDDNDFENQLVFNVAEFVQTENSASYSSNNWSSDLSTDGRMTMVGLTRNSNNVKVVTLPSEQDSSDYNRLTQQDTEIEQFQHKKVRFQVVNNGSPEMEPDVRAELMELFAAKEAGVAYMLGHSYVKAKRSSSFLKKFVIDVCYDFLRKNCRGPAVALNIPHICLIEVGMIYYV